MQIPSYQVHNMLKVYSKQLSQTRILERSKALSQMGASDKINISASGKRQTIIDKVAADIVERIAQSGPQDPVDQEIVDKLQGEFAQSVDLQEQSATFVFNVITEDDKKTTNTAKGDNAEYFMKRLEELAKEAVDKNMES